jgi:hypothetical protein
MLTDIPNRPVVYLRDPENRLRRAAQLIADAQQFPPTAGAILSQCLERGLQDAAVDLKCAGDVARILAEK